MTAKSSPDTLQVFVNTILAEGWGEAADEVHPDDLAARAEPFGLEAIPADVLLVTAGVDVQGDRLEISIVGHGRDAAFVLAHLVVWGGPGDDSSWTELDELNASKNRGESDSLSAGQAGSGRCGDSRVSSTWRIG